jgi:DNA polymerase I-like protein with 3'-5' exonuclease and polymerase domains
LITKTTVELYKGDLPRGRFTGRAIAIDTETLGLNPYRDRLCLVQLSEGDGSAVLVQLEGSYDASELKRLLADESVLKIFHFGRFDMAVLKHYLGVMPRSSPAPSPTGMGSRTSARSFSASSCRSSSNPPTGGRQS